MCTVFDVEVGLEYMSTAMWGRAGVHVHCDVMMWGMVGVHTCCVCCDGMDVGQGWRTCALCLLCGCGAGL